MITNNKIKSKPVQRQTSQRLKILEYLKKTKTHPTAEMVYLEMRKDLPAISLATVYRNLNLLAEQGMITKLEINNEFHFDGCMCNHQHCICKKCGKLIDIENEEMSNYALHKFKNNDFYPECVNIIFSGNCKKCKEA